MSAVASRGARPGRFRTLLAGSLLLASGAGAEPTVAPRWEAGAGVGAVSFPAYRGADASETWVLPIPYFIYRGRVLRADRDGVNAVFVDEPRLRLDLSGNASPPVRSSRAPIRDGMADLRATAELGPSLEALLWRSADAGTRVSVQVPLRAAVTLEAAPRAIGYVAGAYLNVDRIDALGFDGWALGFKAGPGYQSRRYDRYYYDVGARDALAGRPAYEARGGYAGTEAVVSLSKRYAKSWVGAFLRYDSLAGASFADSPLLRSGHYVAAGVGIVWVLGTSRDTVPVDRIRRERSVPAGTPR